MLTTIKSFLFNNLNPGQTIFKNTFWLAGAEGINKLLRLVLFIYIARILGAAEYGKFSFALAFIGLFAAFSASGLPRIIVREFSQDSKNERDFASILSLKTLLGLGTLVLVFLGSFFITEDPLIQKIIWILAIYSFLDGFAGFMNLFFESRQKMEYESFAKILQAALLVGFSFFVIFYFPTIENLSYGYLAASLISLFLILLFFHFKFSPLKLGFDKSVWKKYLDMSWPLALAGVFTTIYGQMDSVMMGYKNLIQETGWYNAASRTLGAAIIPIGLVATSFFPVLSKAFKESKEKFQKVWDSQIGIVITSAVPLVVGGIVLAPRIISSFYGKEYNPAILVFQILIIMTGILFFYNPFYQALLVSNQQKKFFFVSLLGAVANFILNLILIPKFSLYGAAIASVVASFTTLLFYAIFTFYFTTIKIFNLKLFLTLNLAIFSALIMYFAISWPGIYSLPVFISVAAGVAVYFAVFSGIKIILNKFLWLK